MTIGGRVMRLRASKGWGPEELARRADVSRTTLHELETRPGRRPRAATVYLLAMALGTTAAKLLGLDEVPGFPDQAGALGLIEAEAGPAVVVYLPAEGGRSVSRLLRGGELLEGPVSSDFSG